MRAPSPADTAVAPPYQVMEQAAEWYATLRCGDASPVQLAQWSAWLESDPLHRQAWSYVESVSRQFEPLQRMPDRRSAADTLVLANSRVRRRQVLRCLGALVATGIGWSSWRMTSLPQWSASLLADHRTGVGEVRKVRLADGTQVWLNTASAFNVDFGTARRALQVVMGEVFIDTGHDPARPFIVNTAQGQLRALGTEFTVRTKGSNTLLAVYAGAVQVRTAASGRTQVVEAGQQLSFDSETLQPVGKADLARRAWSQGMLVAVDVPLQQVVEELARYQMGYLSVDPQVAQLKVFGNLPVQDIEAALSILASSLPVMVARPLPWWTTLKARPD